MARTIQYNLGLDGMKVNTNSQSVVSTPIPDVLDAEDISINNKMLALHYYRLGLGTMIPVATFEGRRYLPSEVGNAILAAISVEKPQ